MMDQPELRGALQAIGYDIMAAAPSRALDRIDQLLASLETGLQPSEGASLIQLFLPKLWEPGTRPSGDELDTR